MLEYISFWVLELALDVQDGSDHVTQDYLDTHELEVSFVEFAKPPKSRRADCTTIAGIKAKKAVI
jgi:hypothetical protein